MVIVSAWSGGFIPGLLATLLSYVVADYFFIEPLHTLGPFQPMHFALFGLYLTVGLAVSLLQRALSKSNTALKNALNNHQDTRRRIDLAAEQARIGFHEFIAAEKRQIWTAEMEHLFGIPPGTFEGTFDAWLQRIHPDDRERITAERAKAIRERNADWQYEYRAILPGGGIRWIEGRSRLVFSKSNVLERIVGVNIDVTERRELEQALMDRSTELTRSNEELERFAYAVSHDLQAPLRAVISMAQLLHNRASGQLDDESLHALQIVITNGDRMKNLIRDILELSKLGHDSEQIEREIDSKTAVDLALQELEQPIRESGVKIVIDPLPLIRADEGQLGRLFSNLLSNAIKYKSDKPPEIRISASAHDGEWVFCVSDNGIGIDPKYHDRIFGAFKRLHSSSQYEGTGLGLAICQKIVQRHGGRIWLESEPGKGSKFFFALPKEGVTRDLERKPSQGIAPDLPQSKSAAG